MRVLILLHKRRQQLDRGDRALLEEGPAYLQYSEVTGLLIPACKKKRAQQTHLHTFFSCSQNSPSIIACMYP